MIFLILYAVATLTVNAMIVSATTYDVAIVNQVVLIELQRFTEFVTTLGISLILLRFYITRLNRPERFTFSRIVICGLIVTSAFFILRPAQQKLLQGLVSLAPAEMRREAFVLSVTNYGLVTGDVIIPQLNIAKEELKAPPIQTLFPFLNAILIFSDGYEVVEKDIEPIGRTVINNDLVRNHKVVSTGFDAAMKSSCTGLRKLYNDYTRVSDQTAQDFYDQSDKDKVRRDWREKSNELFGGETNIVPQLNEDEFIDHPNVQTRISGLVEENLRAVEFPDFMNVLGSTNQLADYARARMASYVVNPCATTWASFNANGQKDELVADLVAFYARIAREDYERLGKNGDLNQLGKGVMMFAIAPAISLIMTWLVAAFQLITAFGLAARYYVPLENQMRVAATCVLAFALIILPTLIPSKAESQTKGLSVRFERMSERHGALGVAASISLKSFLRAEERIFPLGRGILELTPLEAFRVFSAPDETE